MAFETNRYSVPSAQAHRALTVKAEVDTVRLYDGAALVAEHDRCYDRHRRISDWRHYLPVLARKPGAVPFAAALRDGALPPVFEQFRQELWPGRRTGIAPSCACSTARVTHPLARVTRAVEQAMACRAYHPDAVCQLLEQDDGPAALPPPLDPGRYPTVPVVHLAPVSSAAYDQLRVGGA